jgi:cell division transport system permease protein
MTTTDIKRIIRSGATNFRRNGIVSIASSLVMTITLSVITGLILLSAVLHSSITTIQNKVDVVIYFTTGATEDKVFAVKGALEKLPEVSRINYITADDALAKFREKYKNDYLTIQALDELAQNPLGARLEVKAKEPSQYESIVKLLEGDSTLLGETSTAIDKVNYYQNKQVIDSLNRIANGARTLGLVITLVLILITIAITFNTVRLTMHFAREEISVMRLVGAENRYIRGPFMVEGIIYGLIGTLIALIIYLPATYYIGKNMTEFLGVNLWNYYLDNILQIGTITLVSGALLGAISAGIAIRKYLRT